jgi:peptidoglycan-associated lipoprotein
MRKTAILVILAGVTALGACGKKPAPPPPAPPPATPATPPPAPPPPRPAPEVVAQPDDYTRYLGMAVDELEKAGIFQDILFDFDKSDIREPDRAVLARNAELLKKFDFLRVTVEGHCDERGSVEYNLALGQRRAAAASDYVTSLGVGADRLKTVSYGKEVPLCREASEDCWARNRRAHFAVTGKSR